MPSDQELESVLRRWEGAVNECEQAGNDSDEAIKELEDSRTALILLLKQARDWIAASSSEARNVALEAGMQRMIELRDKFHRHHHLEEDDANEFDSLFYKWAILSLQRPEEK